MTTSYLAASAIVTEDHRYLLYRRWRRDLGTVLFVMLNPSTADGYGDDPTIRRCVEFANEWGFGAIEVVNLFSFKSSHPRDLLSVQEPVGPDNESHVANAISRASRIVAAWGCPPPPLEDRSVSLAIRHLGDISPVYCLARTLAGNPTHPLARGRHRVPFGKQPELFDIRSYECKRKEIRRQRESRRRS